MTEGEGKKPCIWESRLGGGESAGPGTGRSGREIQ
jgi:hypothetical protein